MKPSRLLYKLTRKVGKAASKANDIETLLTGNPKKIAKRFVSKKTHQASHKTAGNLASKLIKKIFK